MIKPLLNLFKQSDIVDQTNEIDNELELISSLLVEAAAIDGEIDKAEVDKIYSFLVDFYEESQEKISKVLEKCLKESQNPNSLHSFTSKINKVFSYEKKINLIEILWEIVLSDGKIHDFESSLIRRLAGLLYISNIDCGNVKKRVLLKINKEE